jgi:hypothetical protein
LLARRRRTDGLVEPRNFISYSIDRCRSIDRLCFVIYLNMQHHPCFRHLQCLLILVLLLMSASRTGAAVDHRKFIYDGFSGDNLNLTMDGQASVVDGLLRLTSGLPYSKGHAFYPYPLNFTDVPNGSSLSSFSTTFIFSIMGPSTHLRPGSCICALFLHESV